MNNKEEKKNGKMPCLTINNATKFYLAMKEMNEDDLFFVAALYLEQSKPGQYTARTVTEVSCFEDSHSAYRYAATLRQLCKIHQSTGFGKIYDEAIKEFTKDNSR